MNKGVALARGSILGVLNRIRGLFATLSEPGLLIGNCNVRDNRGDLLYLNRPVTLRIEDLMVWKKNVFPVNPSGIKDGEMKINFVRTYLVRTPGWGVRFETREAAFAWNMANGGYPVLEFENGNLVYVYYFPLNLIG